MPSSAFTLIELLVVIAILTILSSMLLPALARGRDRVRSAVCLNHLRHWGLATQMYAGDHEDFLPPEGAPNPTASSTNVGWYIQLPPMIDAPRYHDQAWRTNARVDPGRNIWLCPANARRSNGRNLFHFCLNQHVDGTSGDDAPTRLASIVEPSQTIWLFDTKNLPAVGSWNFPHTNLHSAGAHFAFLDAHTARFRNVDYWDFAAQRGRTNHAGLRWVP